jgi:uncharacterized membrane protein
MTRRHAALLGLSFLGMVDTLYLTLTRDSGPAVCSFTEGCGDVLTSVYSEIGGIPISLFGLGFYFFVFALTVFEAFGGFATFGLLRWPALAALAVSAVLTGIQGFVLEAWCQYCLTSAALSTLIFLTVWTARRNADTQFKEDEADEEESAPPEPAT